MISHAQTREPDDALAPNGWPRALLDGFRAGQRAALTAVYRMHMREVATTLRRGFMFTSQGKTHRFGGYGSAFELQDALHETFRLAFEPRAREAYDGIRPYAPYLRTIARNVVLQHLRRSGREYEVLDDESSELDSSDDHVDHPEQRVYQAELRELVDRFLATLSPDERALVEVRFVEGKSQREAAEALGLGRQRIRTHELKLRAKLLGYLHDHGEQQLIGAGAACLGLVELLALLTEISG